MVLVAIDVVPARSKPLVAVGVGICKRERHELGGAAPFSTKTSFLQERAGGLAYTPKLVERFGPAWTLFAEQQSPYFA